jgi:AcrR family transcriptional regulator
MATTTGRRMRSDGERSRAAILHTAARLATVEGLDGLSIGRLADEVGMSKSGLYAHFGSKEELQLATIETAQEIFAREVVTPALARGSALERAEALADGFLSHVEREIFPGGCFFASAAAELDTRPGAVRERISEIVDGWSELVRGVLSEAQAEGDLRSDVDLDQLAFELNAMLAHANALWVLRSDHRWMERARHGIRRLIDEARAGPRVAPER